MDIFTQFTRGNITFNRNRKITHRELIYCLSLKLHEVLDPLLPKNKAVALLDFPNHSNVGDSAIWAGQKILLRALGVSIPYVCDISTFCHSELSMRLQGGTILLSGGGNLGDLWPHHQAFRERIISTFPNHKIVQLPQSICFRDKENLKRAQRVFNRHPDFTLLLRDKQSLEIARNEFKGLSLLCPDMSFALGPLQLETSPKHELMWLRRKDREAADYPQSDIPETDWVDEDLTWAMEMNRFLRQRMRFHSQNLKKDFHLIARTYDCMARDRLVRGCRMLTQSKRIISDRLHGHILSLLLGIPHICLDNNYGKIKSFYETWTKDCDLVQWANTSGEAMAKANFESRESQLENDIACSA
jgi:exopolysaccharide biosynthesis predicted pyruvyltransferase EpsI